MTTRIIATWAALAMLLTLPDTARSQDASNVTQFFINPYLLNSSFVGLDGQPSLSIAYRKQWMTIDGAPTTANVSLQAPLNSRVSAGINITQDAKGFFNNSAALFTAGYHVPLADHSFLRFGLSVGGSWNTVDMDKLAAINDPALSSVLNKSASLTGNAGMSFHMKLFHLGIALPTLFAPSYVSENAFEIKEVKPFQAVVLHGGSRFYFNGDKNIFEPYLVYRINAGLPAQLEMAALVHLNHVVWVGASVKDKFGVSALGGIKLKNMLAIGASYTLAKRGVDELNSPTFELGMNYLFGSRKKGVSLHSFVNAVKEKERKPSKAAQEAIAKKAAEAEQKRKQNAEAAAALKQQEAEKKKQTAEAARKKQEEEQVKRAQALEQRRADAELQKRLADQKKEEARIQQAEAARLRQEEQARSAAQREEDSRRTEAVQPAAAPQQEAIAPSPVESIPPEPVTEIAPVNDQEQLERLATVLEDPAKAAEDSSAVAKEVRHETVKRGNHAQELAAGQYVIVGAFKSVDNAQHFSRGLANLNLKTSFGHITDRSLWYVYIHKSDSEERARAEQARYSKMFLLRDAWLLTVED